MLAEALPIRKVLQFEKVKIPGSCLGAAVVVGAERCDSGL